MQAVQARPGRTREATRQEREEHQGTEEDANVELRPPSFAAGSGRHDLGLPKAPKDALQAPWYKVRPRCSQRGRSSAKE